LILTGCQTVPEQPKIEIPPFPVPRPERPELLEIPIDNMDEAIKSLTTNITRLVTHIEQLEMYDEMKVFYYSSLKNIYLTKMIDDSFETEFII
jgi:hypothetical protein